MNRSRTRTVRHMAQRTWLAWLAFAMLGLTFVAGSVAMPVSAQTAMEYSCDTVATPMAGHDSMQSSPGAHSMHGTEDASFDQLYIDMMVPHHEAVIALANAAMPKLTDPMLIAMAENIIDTQTGEIEKLLAWRLAWFGDGTPMMDDATMDQMLVAMPVGSMDDMMMQMDPLMQVTAFCAADDPDRAFAEQVLAHHLMAVRASEIAIAQAEHPELAAFAEHVIIDQQREIDILIVFLDGVVATPTS